jgi:adenylyltransferase/sulfurtransferase
VLRVDSDKFDGDAARMPVTLSTAERERYSRHLLLPEIGAAGQERLKAARVAIVGAGGLGSPAALYLAAGGVGTLGIIDSDRLDISNLQRQVLYESGEVGQPKAALARARLAALNPEIAVHAHVVELRAANIVDLFNRYDLIIDGSDRLATRYLVNDACVLLRKPLIAAAIHRFEGQAMTYVPDRGPCYRCLFADGSDDVVPNCAEAGVLGALPGVLGAIQATEAIKLILGVGEPLVGRLLTYDALELRFRELRFQRRRDCAVCGETPSITAPQDPPGYCGEDELRGVRRLSAAQLQALLQERGEPPLLVDVREPEEFAAGHLPSALNIPLGQLAAQLPGLARERPAVFICLSGARSLKACVFAARAGLAAPLQLEGGMRAWSAATRR